jgi:hypothetical protein
MREILLELKWEINNFAITLFVPHQIGKGYIIFG